MNSLKFCQRRLDSDCRKRFGSNGGNDSIGVQIRGTVRGGHHFPFPFFLLSSTGVESWIEKWEERNLNFFFFTTSIPWLFIKYLSMESQGRGQRLQDNTLIRALKTLEGVSTTVDLNNGNSLFGLIESIDILFKLSYFWDLHWCWSWFQLLWGLPISYSLSLFYLQNF